MCDDRRTESGFQRFELQETESSVFRGDCLKNTNPEEFLDLFLQSKHPSTGMTYLRSFRDLSGFLCSSCPGKALSSLLSWNSFEARWMILKYKGDLNLRRFAPATVNLHLSAIRSVVSFARRLGIITWRIQIPFEKVRPYLDTRGPGIEAVRRLINQGNSSSRPVEIRNRAILRLLFDLALRTCEVCRLDTDDVDLDSGTLAVLGKRRTQKQILTLPNPTREILLSWMKIRGDQPGPVFIRMDKARNKDLMSRLSTRSVQRIVRKVAGKEGINATPRGLRHTAITAALDLTGGDVRAVQRFSRHRDIRVLLRYDDNRADLGGRIARLVACSV